MALLHIAEKPNLEPSKLFGVKKLHPLWWFNLRPMWSPPDWKPSWPKWWRDLSWVIRNPLYNFYSYIIGVSDRHFARYGDLPLASFWKYGGARGWKKNVIHYRWLRLPCISYRGKWVEAHWGWNERGKFGMAVRKALAANHDAHNGHDGRVW